MVSYYMVLNLPGFRRHLALPLTKEEHLDIQWKVVISVIT